MDILDELKRRQKKEMSGPEPLRANRHQDVKFRMRLLIAGNEPNSEQARANLQKICSTHLNDNADIQIIDVCDDFAAAIEENILVAPALIVDEPRKVKIFGTLQDAGKVLSALGIV